MTRFSKVQGAFFVVGLFIVQGQSHAVTGQQACAAWTNMAHTFAVNRDAGGTYADAQKKLSTLRPSSGGLTTDNIQMAKNLAKMVFRDFVKKSPDEIASLVAVTCDAVN